MIHVSIVTPEGVVYDDAVSQVSVPTETGEVTILANHVPMVSAMKAGELVFVKQDGSRVPLAVSRGVLEIRSGNKVVVLTDTAERAEHIDLEAAEAARARAEEVMKGMKNVEDVDFARVQASLEREMARLRVGKKYRKLPPTV